MAAILIHRPRAREPAAGGSGDGGYNVPRGFPTSGTPTPRIAEEVKRNRPQFDYIVENNLKTQEGLAKAYANGFDVAMPTSAIAVKDDWIPFEAMLQWIPELET